MQNLISLSKLMHKLSFFRSSVFQVLLMLIAFTFSVLLLVFTAWLEKEGQADIY